MCHYNVLKCIRCRRVYPQGYELCENLDQGAICIDKEKLTTGAESTISTSDISSKSSPVELFKILRHKYEYTDGCLNCGS